MIIPVKKKRQHYIAQHYLRNFSYDDEYLYVFPFKNHRSFKNSIKNLCKEDFFYGSDPKATEFEQNLAVIENMQSRLLKKIIRDKSLDYFDKNEYIGLLSFILLQISRTRSAKKNSQYLANFIEKGYSLNEKITPKDPSDIFAFQDLPRDVANDLNTKYRRAFGLTMLGAINSVEGILDLKAVLLLNITENNYICSDSPIVLYNGIKFVDGRLTGLLSPGLQIFCPINNDIMLLLYDPNAYFIDFDYDSIVFVDKKNDVDELNKLQITNALDFIIYSNPDQKDNIEKINREIDEIVEKVLNFNFGSVGKGEQILKRINGNFYQLFGFFAKKSNFNLDLSFIKLNREFSLYHINEYNNLLEKDSFPNPIRNKNLADKAQMRLEKSYNEILNEFKK